jgi:hypothetical protein
MQLRALGATANHPDHVVERDDATAHAGEYRDFVVAASVNVSVDQLAVEAGDLHVAADHSAGGGALEFEHLDSLLGGPGKIFDVRIIGFASPEVHAPRGQYLGTCFD